MPARRSTHSPAGPLSRAVEAVLARVLVVLLAALVAVAVFDLAAWLILGRAWAAVEEIQGLLMIWFGLLGAVYAFVHGLHLSLELVVTRLPAGLRRVSERLATCAVGVFGLLLAFYAARLALVVDNTLAATGWSAAHQYVPGAFAGVLLALLAGESLLRPLAAEEATGDGSDP